VYIICTKNKTYWYRQNKCDVVQKRQHCCVPADRPSKGIVYIHAEASCLLLVRIHNTSKPATQRCQIRCHLTKGNNNWYIHSLVVCLMSGPGPLPQRALHIVKSRASYFKWEYPLLSLTSSNNFLRLLPCLPLTSNPPCIFPSVTRCRRQFLRKMW
jgi:hypothetical protein